MRRRVTVLALLTLMVAALLAASVRHGAAPVVAQQPEPDEPTTETTLRDEPPSHDIVIRPDEEPRAQRPEDSGGALQIAVLLIVLAGVGTIAVLAVRESRRRRGRTASHA
jgi:hypothetical protein